MNDTSAISRRTFVATGVAGAAGLAGAQLAHADAAQAPAWLPSTGDY